MLSRAFLPFLIYLGKMGPSCRTEREGAVEGEYVTMREAQEILGVSNFTIWQMVRDGRLPAYRSETDRRKKLVRRADIDALRAPKPIGEAAESPKKVAA